MKQESLLILQLLSFTIPLEHKNLYLISVLCFSLFSYFFLALTLLTFLLE